MVILIGSYFIITVLPTNLSKEHLPLDLLVLCFYLKLKPTFFCMTKATSALIYLVTFFVSVLKDLLS